MKLSSIIAYRNQLESVSLVSIRGQAEHELSAINHVVSSNESDIGFYKHRIEKRFSVVWLPGPPEGPGPWVSRGSRPSDRSLW